MQDLPEKTSLLQAVARFLGDERLKKEVRDPALLFRLKIAVHVIESAVREERAEDGHDRAELERLSKLFGDAAPARELSRAAMRTQISALNVKLAAALRAGEDVPFADRARAHLKQTLIEKLSVTQPRFDTSDEIE